MACKRKTPGNRVHLEGFLLRERECKKGERETCPGQEQQKTGAGRQRDWRAEEKGEEEGRGGGEREREVFLKKKKTCSMEGSVAMKKMNRRGCRECRWK